MRIALVHDYLNEAGGAERVLRVLADMYSDAPIYTSFVKNRSAKEMFDDRRIEISLWGWFLKIGRFYSFFRFLLPWVWKSVDLRSYDLVITSCSGYIARGFRVGPHTRVIAYCHTPPKWLYGYETPTDGQRKWWGKAYLWVVGPFVRYFDYTSAQRVNVWIANSQEVARRIEKFYRKKAIIVYPPIDMNHEARSMKDEDKGEYYLTVARVTGAKGLIDAARAAQYLHKKLLIVGEVVENKVGFQLRKFGPQIVSVGWVDDQELSRLYTHARGYIALAKDEDFGMTVVEAMMQGTPVLAYKGGGYLETVVDGETGILIDKTDVDSVAKGIRRLEKTEWDKEAIKKWAHRFDRTHFEKGIRKVVGL